ncbi:hypothetical protein N7507_008205, partial [Penicillium longicatenatum]
KHYYTHPAYAERLLFYIRTSSDRPPEEKFCRARSHHASSKCIYANGVDFEVLTNSKPKAACSSCGHRRLCPLQEDGCDRGTAMILGSRNTDGRLTEKRYSSQNHRSRWEVLRCMRVE